MISKSPQWQDEAIEFLKSLRELAQNAYSGLPEISIKIRIPEKIKVDTEEDVKDLWERINTTNTVFQLRAVNVCRECFKKADKLLAIRLMNGVCKWKDEAIKMSENLADQDTDLWIKSWKMLDYSTDLIQNKIINLYKTKPATLIRQAIFELFQDNEKRRDALWENYRDWLIKRGEKKDLDILARFFPDYSKPQSDGNQLLESNRVTDLIKDISDGLNGWRMQKGDLIELSGQLEAMQDIFSQPERLVAKWKMAKSLIPEDLDRRSQVKVNQLDHFIQSVMTTEADSTGLGREFPSIDIEPDKDEKPINKNRRRHPRIQAHPPRILQQLNLHEFSLEDAKVEFENAFTAYRDDETVGALIVIHGYGKDKNKSVIKEWMNERIKRLKGHRRVRCIIKGEEIIDPFDKKAEIIRAAAGDVDFSSIGVNTPGYTVIVFKRD